MSVTENEPGNKPQTAPPAASQPVSSSPATTDAGDDPVEADQQFAEAWANNPNIPRLIHQLKGSERLKEARQELFPLRGKIPADEWEQRARKLLAEEQ